MVCLPQTPTRADRAARYYAGVPAGCPLTPRELAILDLVACGRASKQIAATLTISETTVKNHLTRIFAKLGAWNRAHAVARALACGWLALSDHQSPFDRVTTEDDRSAGLDRQG